MWPDGVLHAVIDHVVDDYAPVISGLDNDMAEIEDAVFATDRARGFDPETRFYAVENNQVVGYCVLEVEQGRVGFPWCKRGAEGAAGALFDAALATGDVGVVRLHAARLDSLFERWHQPMIEAAMTYPAKLAWLPITRRGRVTTMPMATRAAAMPALRPQPTPMTRAKRKYATS